MKALYRRAEILIMDEPTSALTALETEKLADLLFIAMADKPGHRLHTRQLPIVLRVSDRVTVLRQGKVG